MEELLNWLDLILRSCKNREERKTVMINMGYNKIGEGHHKDVFTGPVGHVIKIASKDATLRDFETRNLYPGQYAKTLFGEFTQIQKFGKPMFTGANSAKKLSDLRKKCPGLEDIRQDNVRFFGNDLKIIDARPRREKKVVCC